MLPKKRGRPRKNPIEEKLSNVEESDFSEELPKIKIKQEKTDWSDKKNKEDKLLKVNLDLPKKIIKQELTEDNDPECTPPPPKRRRGRRPLQRPPPDQIEPASLTNTSLQDGVVLKKPRKPRQEKKEKRNPYKKHQKKPPNDLVIDPDTGQYMIKFPTSDISLSNNEITESNADNADNQMFPKKSEDTNQMLFNNFFNKRLIKNVDVIEQSSLTIFRTIDSLKASDYICENEEIEKKILDIQNHFQVLYNRFISLEKNLGSFLIKILRGYLSSKICPIPIQTPWQLRTEVMDNENKTWIDLQRQINLFFNTINNTEYASQEVSDDEMLQQKTSSFFLGRGADTTKIPSFIYNSDWLVTETGSRGNPDVIVVGGGTSDHVSNRTHTVISSFRNDMNHGLQLPDIPTNATRIMTQDKQGIGINTQRDLPICDSNIFQ